MDSGLASASLRRPGMTRLTKVDALASTNGPDASKVLGSCAKLAVHRSNAVMYPAMREGFPYGT
jgi:hypothetical protein